MESVSRKEDVAERPNGASPGAGRGGNGWCQGGGTRCLYIVTAQTTATMSSKLKRDRQSWQVQAAPCRVFVQLAVPLLFGNNWGRVDNLPARVGNGSKGPRSESSLLVPARRKSKEDCALWYNSNEQSLAIPWPLRLARDNSPIFDVRVGAVLDLELELDFSGVRSSDRFVVY